MQTEHISKITNEKKDKALMRICLVQYSTSAKFGKNQKYSLSANLFN